MIPTRVETIDLEGLAGAVADARSVASLPTLDVPATALAATTTDDAANLADLVDSLRGRMAPSGDLKPAIALPPAALELFRRCAKDYRRESDKLVDRRHRIGTLVYPESPAQASAIGEFFAESLGLRIVDIDVGSLDQLGDEELDACLETLTEPTAHIVAVLGMASDSDPRLFAAIRAAHVDVLVLGFAERGAKFGPEVQACLRYRIDLQQEFPLEVVFGCFDAAAQPDAEGRAAGDAGVDPATSPGKRHTLTERLFGLFRHGARAA